MFICIRKKYIDELSRLAIPLIIQNITSMLIGLIDEMFVGRISAEAYGAIGITVSLMNFIAGIFGYFAVAFNIEGAKRKGQNDEDGFKVFFMSSILLDFLIGIVYGIFLLCLAEFVFSTLYGLSGEALNVAVIYAYLTCPYMLFQLLIFTFNSYFKIIKKTDKLMWVSTGATILNVVLDYLLIFGKFGFPKLGAAGAAIATIVSVFLNVLLLSFMVCKDIKFNIGSSKIYLAYSIKLIKRSLPLVGEELLEGSIFVVVLNAIISNIGIKEIGSYLLVKNIMDIILISMYMYGSAELTLVSERIGKKIYPDIKKMASVGVVISMVIYFVLSAIITIFRNKVPMLISDDAELISYSATIIIPMVLMNFFNPIQIIYKYVLQACDDAKFVLCFTAIINVITLIIILILYMINFGLYSIFIGLFINYLTLTIAYVIRLDKIICKISDVYSDR